MLAGNGFGITGAASTVARDNLPSNVVLVSNDKGKIAPSSLTVNSIQGIIIGGATTITDFNLTPNKVVISNADGKVATSSVSDIEVGYLYGATDSIQNQLNNKAEQSTTYTKTEVDNGLSLKADQSTTYTKTEVDNSLGLKANQATTYTKTEVDNSLLLKANQSTTYTKTEVNDRLALKANQSTTYTKTEVDNKLVLKANQSTTYTISQIDALNQDLIDSIALKSDQSFVDNQLNTINTALNNKQNTLTTIPRDISTFTYPILNNNQIRALRSSDHISLTISPESDALTISTLGIYSVAETNTLLDTKANQSTTYTISQVDALNQSLSDDIYFKAENHMLTLKSPEYTLQ